MTYTVLPDVEYHSPEWFARRLPLVTASDIARLAHGGPATWAAVKAEKNGGATWRGNVYTRWGSEREPVIAEHVEFQYDVHPNQSMIVADDPRWAATPDGLGDRNGEYKTTVKDWPVNVDSIPSDYRDQVWWAQLVTEVDETVFAWEPHENFVPGPIRDLIIPRNQARIAELVEVAERFLVFMTEDEKAGEFDDLIALAAERKRLLDEATAAYDDVKLLVRDRVGDRASLSAKSPFGSISLAMPKPRETFDETAFKAAHPDLWSQFRKTTQQAKPTLRITV